MKKREILRDADGNKVCQFCGGPLAQSGVGRSRDYCSRTHKEYAYRQRRDTRLVEEALEAAAAAAAGPDSTTAGTKIRQQPKPVSAVVETASPQVSGQKPRHGLPFLPRIADGGSSGGE